MLSLVLVCSVLHIAWYIVYEKVLLLMLVCTAASCMALRWHSAGWPSLTFFFCLALVAATACNNPIFSEIVPPHMRNLIYAFDRSFEGAIAASGAPLVGILAEKAFGFSVRAPVAEVVFCLPKGLAMACREPCLWLLFESLPLFQTGFDKVHSTGKQGALPLPSGFFMRCAEFGFWFPLFSPPSRAHPL